MKSPVNSSYRLQAVDEVDSTQKLAAELLTSDDSIGAVMAHNQTAGKGRFGREWFSEPGDSLTFSLILRDYADHPKPYLLGMSIGLAVAGAVHAQIRWPNDVVIGDKKVAGLLTELVKDSQGRSVAIVGIGVNLNQAEFPKEIREIATSLRQAHGSVYEARRIAEAILARISLLPEPDSWADLQPIWALLDRTPGKRYRLATDEEAVAVGVGSDGQLICSVNGESHSVLAAEALFGPA